MQDERRTKKRKIPTNVARALELAQKLLRLADVPANTVPLSEFLATAGYDTTGLAAEFNKAQTRIADFKSVKTMTVRRQKEVLDEDKQRHAEEVRFWKETSRKIPIA